MKFFKKIWYSITKIEKYPEMSAEGTKNAIKYIVGMVAFLAIIVALGITYQTYGLIKNTSKYMENNFPDISYKEGIMTTKTEQPTILKPEELEIGKIIIDLNEKTPEEINQYKNEIKEAGGGILILKDNAIIMNYQIEGETKYTYADMTNKLGITEFNKTDIINYINSSKMMSVYFGLFIMLFIYSIIIYIISSLWTALIIGILGYVSTLIVKIKIRFRAIFNMAIYALTLSTILNIIYILINIFISFTVTYFQVMYISVAFIYLIAAIFLMRVELVKQQQELNKIEVVQKEVKKQMEEDKKPKEKKKEESKGEKEEQKNKEEKEKPKVKKKTKKDELEGEPEGSMFKERKEYE